MRNGQSMAEAMAEMAQSIHATPNNRRRLKSGTFWDRLGCKRRTPERIEQVRGLLEYHRVSVSLRKRGSMDTLQDVPFGSEDRDGWIVLTHEAPMSEQGAPSASILQPTSQTMPLDSWFQNMTQIGLRSESEVVIKFIKPLFEQLGYEEPDFAFEHPVVMRFGREKLTKEADVVLFKRDDHSNDTHVSENVLIFAEAKKLGKPLDGDVVGQANSYAVRLSPVYYVLTNGDAIEVWRYQMTVVKDVPVIAFTRADLKEKWSDLFQLLCKKRVLEIKDKRRQIIAELQRLCQSSAGVCPESLTTSDAPLPSGKIAAL